MNTQFAVVHLIQQHYPVSRDQAKQRVSVKRHCLEGEEGQREGGRKGRKGGKRYEESLALSIIVTSDKSIAPQEAHFATAGRLEVRTQPEEIGREG